MDELVAWLRGVLDETERVARAAAPGQWSYGDIESIAGGTIYDPSVAIASVDWDVDRVDGRIRRTRPAGEADATGAHIARHDPRSVLARVEAERAIVAVYEEYRRHGWPGVLPAVYEAERHVRLLAYGHRFDAEGYCDEWAPENAEVPG